MLENLCVFVLLITVPALLWSMPKTRCLNTPWLIAWKIVPLGFLIFWLIPDLIINLLGQLNEKFAWFPNYYLHHSRLQNGLFLVGLAAALLLCFSLIRTARRQGPFPTWRRIWQPFGVTSILFAGVLIAFVIAFAFIRFSCNVVDYRATGSFQGSWTPIFLPDEDTTSIVFEQYSIHPFLAEYDYRLNFRQNGQNIICNLRRNCGGRTHFNLYRLRDGRLFFADKTDEYIVDPAHATVLYVFTDATQKYAVPLPEDPMSSCGWSLNQDKMVFLYNNLPPVEAKPVNDLLNEKIYYGCITEKFYPATKKAEQPLHYSIESRATVPSDAH